MAVIGLGEAFEKYSGNPLSIPDYGTAFGPVHPCVPYFPSGEDGYKFWFYYELVDTGGIESLALVRSVSDGITFVDTGISNPILSPGAGGQWDDRQCADPDVIKVGSTWYLYYNGANMSDVHAIGLATSSDGKSWTKITNGIGGTSKVLVPDGSPEEQGNMMVCPSLYYDGSTFWMWYITKNASNIYRVRLAHSADGKTWVRDGTVYVPADIWHIKVVLLGSTYYMHYCQASSGPLHLAYSTDKTTWALATVDPVMPEFSSPIWDAQHIYRSAPIQDLSGNGLLIGGVMWFYYSCRHITPVPQYYKIGLAKSYSDMNQISLQCPAQADNTRIYYNAVAWTGFATSVGLATGYGDAAVLKQGSSMRWTNVQIPNGATILSAYLTLVCDFNMSLTDVKSRITGHDVDNAVNPTTLGEYQTKRGTVVGGGDDSQITSAVVDWDFIPAWTLNAEYNSPDFVAVIQEIINRGGWASGNALLVWWDDHANRSTQAADRRRYAYSYWEDSAKAPIVVITFRSPGWKGKISGVTNPAKVMGVNVANIATVKGVS